MFAFEALEYRSLSLSLALSLSHTHTHTHTHTHMSRYVEGDMLDGDNQYLCGKCGEKKDTLKRVCLKATSLPKTLIFHLKRFEFDMDTLQRMKVNNRCEFPHNLDMRSYTNDDESHELPDSHFSYELVGIVVHAGCSESGHYYSFIRDRNTTRWIHFNDSNVESFDPSDIENQCFGGLDSSLSSMNGRMMHNNTAFEKAYNAYLLIYDRKDSTATLSQQANVTNFVLDPQVLSKILNFNASLLHDKQIFSTPYRDLMWNLCELDSSPNTCKLITTFVFEVLLLAKDRSGTNKFIRHLESIYLKNLEVSKWFLEITLSSWTSKFLMYCPNVKDRHMYTRIVRAALQCIFQGEGNNNNNNKENVELLSRFVNKFVTHLDTIMSPRLRRHTSWMDNKTWPWKYHAQYFTILDMTINVEVLKKCDCVVIMEKFLHFFRNVRQYRAKQRKKQLRRGGGFVSNSGNNSLTRIAADSTPIVEVLDCESTESSGDQDTSLMLTTALTKKQEESVFSGPHVLLSTLARVIESISPSMWSSGENEDIRFVLSSTFLSGIIAESSNRMSDEIVQPYV